ncbi:MAG: hypothetical protein Greene041619_1023 [Candidatus Peregrinibacteria bacterium Greene0416_19]|nr:MAG: hypothetical protein Greene041619_1023 [Candidatus Peregrinibacteria bacterium Greene0416_19]
MVSEESNWPPLELVEKFERILNQEAPFTREDTLKTIEGLMVMARGKMKSGDVRLLQDEVERMIDTFTPRLRSVCELAIDPGFKREVVRQALDRTQGQLEEGKLDYLAAEDISMQLRGALEHLEGEDPED